MTFGDILMVQFIIHAIMISLLRNPNSSHTHTSAYAHGGAANLLASSLQLIQKGGNLSSTSAAQRVTKGNGAALGVDLFLRNTQLIGAPQALAGKSLVDLEDIHILLGDASEVEGLGDGLPGALSHEEGLDSHNRGADILADNGLSELLGGGALHEENSSGAIGDLAGVAGMDGAIFGESGTDLS